jgi:putative ABC transport system permease protein
MMRDYTKLAWNNLTHRKTRSWLTLIGIFIGIAAVVALISLGQGLSEAVTSEFLKLGADKMQISPKGQEFGGSQQNNNDLRERDIKTIQQTNGVLHTVGFKFRSAKTTWGKDQVGFFSVIATSDDPVERQVVVDYFTLKLAEGRELKQGDRSKAVIGYQLTNPDTLEQPIKIGDKIQVNGTNFEVVGAYKQMGDPFADNAVYISEDGFDAVYGKQDKYDGIIVQSQPNADVNLVADDITQALRRERNLKEGDENFEVQTPQELVDSFQQVFGIVQAVIFGIAGISLIVGGIGIMNTMYTAVLERTKEIGLMKAIGATNNTIMLIFLIESGLLGLVGGLIGVLFGLGLAYLTAYIGKTVLDTLLLNAWFSWWLIIGALAFAFIVGVLSGVLPARAASKQQAVQSLRYE